MKLTKAALFALTCALALIPIACGNSARISGLAQSCGSTADCEAELLCVNQTCVQNSYPVEDTAKECVLIECTADADCCDADATTCFEECNLETNRCVFKVPACTSDFDCNFNETCDLASGKCIECMTNDDCDTDETCSLGQCITGCKADEECDTFETCNVTSGLCEYTGCTSQRECILFLGRADAVCEKTATSKVKECVVPCKETAECGRAHVCDKEEGICKFLGCETDDECVTYFKGMNGDSPLGSDISAKCQALKK